MSRLYSWTKNSKRVSTLGSNTELSCHLTTWGKGIKVTARVVDNEVFFSVFLTEGSVCKYTEGKTLQLVYSTTTLPKKGVSDDKAGSD